MLSPDQSSAFYCLIPSASQKLWSDILPDNTNHMHLLVISGHTFSGLCLSDWCQAGQPE